MKISSLNTSHSLARELLEDPDFLLIVTVGDQEYVVDHTRTSRHVANYDDSCMYKTLVCREVTGNIVR